MSCSPSPQFIELIDLQLQAQMKTPELHSNTLEDFTTNAIILLQTYKLQFKIVGLITICVVGYLLGRLKKTNTFQLSLDKLNNAEHFKNQLNKDLTLTKARITKVTRLMRTFLIAGITIAVIFLLCLFSSVGSYVPALYPLYSTVIVFACYVGLTLYKKLLSKRATAETSNLNNIYAEEQKQVEKVLKMLSARLTGKLKVKLEAIERQTYDRNSKKECDLYACKETIRTLKDAQTFFEKIFVDMTSFKWCQKCADQKADGTSFLKVDLKNLNTAGLSLEDMKKVFNKLLQIYTIKVKQLEGACVSECSKEFCASMRPISQRFYEQLAVYEKRLTQLKTVK